MSQLLEGISLEELTEDHIKSLILLKMSEDTRIEYKKELNLAIDKEKREFCKDVSAMANSQGGYIFFGVIETNGMPTSAPGIEYDDSVRQKIHQILTSGISPRIQSMSDAAIKLKNNKHVLALKIQPDGYLHQVKYNDNRYYKRTGTITINMESSDVETFFRSSGPESRKEEVEEIIENYYAELRSRKYFKGVEEKGLVTLVIIPEISSYKMDLSNLPSNFNILFKPIYCSGWDSEITGTAKLTFGRYRDAKFPHAVTEVTQFGEVKAFNSFLLESPSMNVRLPEGCVGFIPSVAYERELIIATHRYLNSLKEHGVQCPFFISIALLNIRGYIMYVDPFQYYDVGRILQKDEVRPELIHISNESEFSERPDASKILRPAFDFIWREFGFEGSYNYDADSGVWTPHA